MTTVEKQMELKDKILIGLKKAYSEMVKFKKQNNTEIVIIRDNKIIKIKPECYFNIDLTYHCFPHVIPRNTAKTES